MAIANLMSGEAAFSLCRRTGLGLRIAFGYTVVAGEVLAGMDGNPDALKLQDSCEGSLRFPNHG
jgi:hypothetical protein